MNTTVTQRFSIAPAAVSDCPECARLLVKHFGEQGVDASAEQLSRVLENVVADAGRGFVLLARDDRRIVGIAYVATILSAEHFGLVAWLEELYVTSSLRSRGIGTALMTAILERARETETGIVAIDLEIDAGHSRAESLYRRFGFRPLDRSRWVRELTT